MNIFVKGLQFVGNHGVYNEERLEGRRFSVDVALKLDGSVEIDDDDISTTLDYREVANVILKHGQGPPVKLLETLLVRIRHDLFELSPRVVTVEISISKRATGVPGDPDWVGASGVFSRSSSE